MRRALIVGIDQYHGAPLRGCVNDAKKMADLLKTNEDGSPNFECKTLTAPPFNIGRADLKSRIKELFINEADVALLYFSGHGAKNILGGYLVTQDAQQHDEGVPMSDVIALANKSSAQEVVVLLDCCHSGALGDLPGVEDKTLLREGVSILTASRGSQVAVEIAGGGVFTSLLCAALEGGASDVLGRVTIASIYAYVDQSLGAWDQRPLFKALVSKLIPLRTCNPVVPLEVLRRLPEYFKSEGAEFQLDPSFEPDLDPKHPEHEAIFRDLQRLRDARLLVAVGAEHMFYAAINSRSCKLTALGRFHWNLAKAGKL
jgi:hypothetical protein